MLEIGPNAAAAAAAATTAAAAAAAAAATAATDAVAPVAHAALRPDRCCACCACGLLLRAATAGYLLRRWGVDCSPDARLNPDEYQLALRDPEGVAKQVNLAIAPGFSLETVHK